MGEAGDRGQVQLLQVQAHTGSVGGEKQESTADLLLHDHGSTASSDTEEHVYLSASSEATPQLLDGSDDHDEYGDVDRGRGIRRRLCVIGFRDREEEERFTLWARAKLGGYGTRALLALSSLAIMGSLLVWYNVVLCTNLPLFIFEVLAPVVGIITLAFVPNRWRRFRRFLCWWSQLMACSTELLLAVTQPIKGARWGPDEHMNAQFVNPHPISDYIHMLLPSYAVTWLAVFSYVHFRSIELIPFHLSTILAFFLWWHRAQRIDLLFSNALPYALISCTIWDRETAVRDVWLTLRRRSAALFESRRNVAHDVRNSLQEILALIEINALGRTTSRTPSPAPGPLIGSVPDCTAEIAPRVVVEVIGDANSQAQMDGVEPKEGLSESKASASAGSPSSTKSGDAENSSTTTTTDGAGYSTDGGGGGSGGGGSSASSESASQYLPHILPSAASHGERGRLLLRQVRGSVDRISARLNSALRDDRRVVANPDSSLTPTLGAHDLPSVITRNLRHDPSITFSYQSDFPAQICTDAEWVLTCLQNLVGNAKLHGPRNGRVFVHLNWIAVARRFRVEVRDEGEGVTADTRRDILEGKGSGIGLKAVRSYVKALGGNLGIDGSTFWFSVPEQNRPVVMHPVFLSFGGAAEARFRDTKDLTSAEVTMAMIILMVSAVVIQGGSDRPHDEHHRQTIYDNSWATLGIVIMIISFGSILTYRHCLLRKTFWVDVSLVCLCSVTIWWYFAALLLNADKGGDLLPAGTCIILFVSSLGPVFGFVFVQTQVLFVQLLVAAGLYTPLCPNGPYCRDLNSRLTHFAAM